MAHERPPLACDEDPVDCESTGPSLQLFPSTPSTAAHASRLEILSFLNSSASKHRNDKIGPHKAALADLKRSFGDSIQAVRCRRSSGCDRLLQLNYRGHGADVSKRIVQECRNLILEELTGHRRPGDVRATSSRDGRGKRRKGRGRKGRSEPKKNGPSRENVGSDAFFRVVCLGFVKFFNFDEKDVPVDVATVLAPGGSLRLYEKLDGSIAILYWYGGRWRVASNNSPDGSPLIRRRGKSVRPLAQENQQKKKTQQEPTMMEEEEGEESDRRRQRKRPATRKQKQQHRRRSRKRKRRGRGRGRGRGRRAGGRGRGDSSSSSSGEDDDDDDDGDGDGDVVVAFEDESPPVSKSRSRRQGRKGGGGGGGKRKRSRRDRQRQQQQQQQQQHKGAKKRVPPSAVASDRGMSFADLFWHIWNDVEKYDLPDSKPGPDGSNTRFVFMFELISPKNLSQIVAYPTESLTLIGCRNMATLDEEPVEAAAATHGWRCVKDRTADFATVWDAIQHCCSVRRPTDFEGFVLCDRDRAAGGDYRRYKIKVPAFVRVCTLKNLPADSFETPRKQKRLLWRLILETNELHDPEFLLHFPEFQRSFKRELSRFTDWCQFLETRDRPDLPSMFGSWDPDGCGLREYLARLPFEDVFRAHAEFNRFRVLVSPQLEEVLSTIKKTHEVAKIEEEKVFSVISEALERQFPCSVRLYGSSLYGMGIGEASDVDMCVLPNRDGDSIDLQDVVAFIKTIPGVQRIRVRDYRNVIQFDFAGSEGADSTLTFCDLCFHRANLVKSELIFAASQECDLLAPLVTLVKHLMKVRYNISKKNKDLHLNSFALTLMVIFYLQDEGILSQLEVKKGKKRKRRQHKKVAPPFEDLRPSIGDLFAGFFRFWLSFNHEESMVSGRMGRAVPLARFEGVVKKEWVLVVEDPVECGENAARTVREKALAFLKGIFHEVLDWLRKGLSCEELFFSSRPQTSES